jgi:stage V sporulation protein D (sporulation-specific penicillin-binding protein)
MKKLFHTYSSYDLKKRLFAFAIAVAFLFLCLIGRLFIVQIIQGKDLQLKAAEQWARDLPVVAGRGLIVDRNGEILAANNATYNIYVRPREVKDTAALSSRLAEILPIEYKDIFLKINGVNISEVTVCKKATKEQANRIIALSEAGVYLSTDIERVYTGGELLSQVLGFITTDNTGQSGLEKYYDKYLRGIDGKILSESDLTGNRIESGTQYYIPPIDGLNIRLTIDAKIQSITENVLRQAMLAHNPIAARAIVLDPQTGEILAMANKPGIDLNDIPRDDLDTLNKYSRNSLAIDIYEPGSTFKIFTVAANIEEYLKGNKNAFSPTHIFPSGRTRVVDGRIIKCWSTHAGGKHCGLNLSGALDHSCNPIFVDIALSLGKETFYKYINAFNFGKVTGIDFPGEGTGMVVPENYSRNGDLARIGFGQSIAVSPLQLAAAAAAAVNGGRYYQPYLVSEIFSPQGITAQRNYPNLINRPISEQTSMQLALMLESVVENGGGRNTYIEGYRVAGKTGTAQKFENGRIAQGKYVSSFVGFFPAHKPQYLCLVIIDEPQGAHYGSVVAAPCAELIFEQIIQYKNIKPFA